MDKLIKQIPELQTYLQKIPEADYLSAITTIIKTGLLAIQAHSENQTLPQNIVKIIKQSKIRIMKNKQQKRIFDMVQKGRNVHLSYRNIEEDDLQYLTKQQTKCITVLDLYSIITAKGVNFFSKANWSNLNLLNLNDNQIGNIGCKYLTRASIQQLSYLGIRRNIIEGAGIIHLSKAQWKELSAIQLFGKTQHPYQNKLKRDALRWLIKINSHKIQSTGFIPIMELDSEKYSTFAEVINLLLSEWKLSGRVYACQCNFTH